MFGHQDDSSYAHSDQSSSSFGSPSTDDSKTSDIAPIQNQDLVADLAYTNPADADTTHPDQQHWQHPGESLEADASNNSTAVSPTGGFPQPLSAKPPGPSPTPASNMHMRASVIQDSNVLTDATDDDLIHVKDKALDELYPLIDKLDQTPEEHFRTLMMIIQASDNHTLVQQAYQVAQTIEDEKVRAQALLDIINEINYFTQQPEL